MMRAMLSARKRLLVLCLKGHNGAKFSPGINVRQYLQAIF
jgi:hypothetical protein